MRHLGWLLAAVLLFEPGCASQRAIVRVPPERYAGCYDMQHGAWNPAEESKFSEPPAHVVLIWNGPKKRHTVGAIPGTTPSIHTVNSWAVVDEGITVSWSTGFSGVVMKLHPVGTNLEGTLNTFWDFPAKPSFAPVTLTRVTCPHWEPDAGPAPAVQW